MIVIMENLRFMLLKGRNGNFSEKPYNSNAVIFMILVPFNDVELLTVMMANSC